MMQDSNQEGNVVVETPSSVFLLLSPLLINQKFSISAPEFLSKLAQLLCCQRASLGFVHRNYVKICAVSQHHQSLEQSILPDVSAAMEESILQSSILLFPQPPGVFPHITFSHAELSRKNGLFCLVTVPLVQNGELIGAITLERQDPVFFSSDQLAFVEQLSVHLGPLLFLKYSLQRPLWWRFMAAIRQELLGDLEMPLRLMRGILLSAIGLCILILFTLPLPSKVAAQAHLDPLTQRVVSAPIDGYLKEVHFRPGDQVHAGQLLAELNDDNLMIERRQLESDIMQQQNALADAMAKQDRTQVVMHSAKLDEINAQRDLVNQQIGLTKLIAPFDGVVVKGDLVPMLGTPVRRSDALFTLAKGPGLRVIVEVKERDIQDIQLGQNGLLILSALPSKRFNIHVARISPVAKVTDEGVNVFEVETSIEGMASELAPGMKGNVKILTGTRPIGLQWAMRAWHAIYYFVWSHM